MGPPWEEALTLLRGDFVVITVVLVVGVMCMSFFAVEVVLALGKRQCLTTFVDAVRIIVCIVNLKLILSGLGRVRGLVTCTINCKVNIVTNVGVRRGLTLNCVAMGMVAGRCSESLPGTLESGNCNIAG